MSPRTGRLVIAAGEQFGRGLVLDPDVGRNQTGNVLAGLLCSPALGGCGTLYQATASSLRRKRTRSCGCLHDEKASTRATARNITHGLSSHPLYDTWQSIIARCEDPTRRAFTDYGGRGITVCPEWHDLARFIADVEAEIGHRPAGRTPGGMPAFTLNRIDNDGNYDPGNVEWADYVTQARNRRRRGAGIPALVTFRLVVASGKARQIRQQADLSVRTAAAAANVSTSAVQRWEAGQRVPNGEAALRYAAFLEALPLPAVGGQL